MSKSECRDSATIFVDAAVPQALPQLVREKIKELYQSFDRGVSVSADISEMRKFEENNGRKQRRKRIDREGEGDTAEWGSMGKAMAGEVHFQKQLKMVHDRDGQPMYHTGHHETEHSMEEGVVVSVLMMLSFYHLTHPYLFADHIHS
jgi:hypothetical protein